MTLQISVTLLIPLVEHEKGQVTPKIFFQKAIVQKKFHCLIVTTFYKVLRYRLNIIGE